MLPCSHRKDNADLEKYNRTSDWSDVGRLRNYIQEVGFKNVRSKTIRPRWDFEGPDGFLDFFLESKNPEFVRAYQPWWNKGMERIMRPTLERIVKKNYDDDENLDLEVFLFIARK